MEPSRAVEVGQGENGINLPAMFIQHRRRRHRTRREGEQWTRPADAREDALKVLKSLSDIQDVYASVC